MFKFAKQVGVSILIISWLAVGINRFINSQSNFSQISFITQTDYSSQSYCPNDENAEKFKLFSTENLNNSFTQYIDTQIGATNGLKGIKKITMDKGYGLVSFTIDSQISRVRNILEGGPVFVSNVDTEKTHPLNNNLWDTFVIATTVSSTQICPNLNSVNEFETLYKNGWANILTQQWGGNYTSSYMLALNTLTQNSKLCLYFKISAQPYGMPYGSPVDNDIFRNLTSFEYSYCPQHSKPDLTISTAGYCDASSTKIELSLNNIGGATTQGYQEIQINGKLIEGTVLYGSTITTNDFWPNGVVCPQIGGAQWLLLIPSADGGFKLSGKGFNISPNKACKYLLTVSPASNKLTWDGSASMTDEENTTNNKFNGFLDFSNGVNNSCNTIFEDDTLSCEEILSSIDLIPSNGSLLIQPILKEWEIKLTNNSQLPKGYNLSCNYSINGVNQWSIKNFTIPATAPGTYTVNCSLEFMGKKIDDCKEISYTIKVPDAVCGDGVVQAQEQCDNGVANNDWSWCTTSCEFRCDVATNTDKLPEVIIKLLPYPLANGLTAQCSVNGSPLDLVGGMAIGNFWWGGVFNVLCEVNGSLGGSPINASCKAGFNTFKGWGTNNLNTLSTKLIKTITTNTFDKK